MVFVVILIMLAKIVKYKVNSSWMKHTKFEEENKEHERSKFEMRMN